MVGRPVWRVEWFDKRGARQLALVSQRWYPTRDAAVKHVADAFSGRLGYVGEAVGGVA